MRDYVVNLNMQFVETSDCLIKRIDAAASHGFRHVEFWRWQELDLDALAGMVSRTGVAVESFVVDWSVPLTDPQRHSDYVLSWERSLRLAERLHTRQLILALGDVNPALDEAGHLHVLSDILGRLASQAMDAGLTLLIEPVNALVDHPGTWLDSTEKAFQLIDGVAAPTLKLLLDIYHLAISGENLSAILQERAADIGYVQLADAPGHGEPGAGTIDWRSVCKLLSDAGLASRIGLEIAPHGPSDASLRRSISFLDRYW